MVIRIAFYKIWACFQFVGVFIKPQKLPDPHGLIFVVRYGLDFIQIAWCDLKLFICCSAVRNFLFAVEHVGFI